MRDAPHLIGRPILRTEDRRFLTGTGRYISDIKLNGMVYGAMLYSPFAHARIRKINFEKALQHPGVLAVLTAQNLEPKFRNGIPPLFTPNGIDECIKTNGVRPLLAKDFVRHVGDRVAFCVAENLDCAIHALDLIDVEYEELKPVVDIKKALDPEAPLVWNEVQNNTLFEIKIGDQDATSYAFEHADHVVELKGVHPRVLANSMEPRAAIGEYESFSRAYTLYTSTQNPHRVRQVLAQNVLSIPETNLRVISYDVGGGFGMKGDCYPEEALVLIAAKTLMRPVKWVATRSESFISDNAGRDQAFYAKMALDRDGHIQAIYVDALHNLGAYMVGAALIPVLFSLKLIPNVYKVPHVDLRTRAVFTNTSPTNPYRGAGRPEAIFITEQLMDLAASKLNLSQYEIRKINFLEQRDLPHRTQTGLTYDSGNFLKAAEKCMELSNWDQFEQRCHYSRQSGKIRGRSLTSYIEDTGAFNDRMEVRFDPSGSATILAGTFSHGQSHETTYRQLLSAWLGIPSDEIHFLQGDTNTVAFGRGTYASGSAHIGGNALLAAADQLIAKGKEIAAQIMKVEENQVTFMDGIYSAISSNQSVNIQDVARASYHPTLLPSQMRNGLEGSAFAAADPPSFPNGCHVCEVEIDLDTGALTLERYYAVDDFGIIINPLIAEGQVHGALAQGIGQAICEEVKYDEAGQVMTASFLDYAMPKANDLPSFATTFQVEPCLTNRLGVKGAGEGGTVAAPVAIANAVANALQRIKAQAPQMPFSSMTLWTAIHKKLPQ